MLRNVTVYGVGQWYGQRSLQNLEDISCII